MSMVIINERLTNKLIEEMKPIIEENHEASGHLDGELDVDWNAYLSLGPNLVGFIMREGDDEHITGIMFFVLGMYPHKCYLKMAQQVTLFVKKKSRQYVHTFLKVSEEHLLSLGVDLIIQTARYKTRFCNTLESEGYDPVDTTFIKRLT